jgi:hypothetical protein
MPITVGISHPKHPDADKGDEFEHEVEKPN